jgi:hypothetical protein
VVGFGCIGPWNRIKILFYPSPNSVSQQYMYRKGEAGVTAHEPAKKQKNKCVKCLIILLFLTHLIFTDIKTSDFAKGWQPDNLCNC